MEDFFAVPEEELRQTGRALRRVFLRRGWHDVKVIRDECLLFFATRPDGKKIRFGSNVPEAMSLLSSRLAASKIVSYYMLEQEGVLQPETIWLPEDKNAWRQILDELLKKYARIVIKPTMGSHGIDVKTDIVTVDEALKVALECAGDQGYRGVIAQEQLEGDVTEIRAICIDYKMVGAYERIPAMVTGDGEHNVLELIEIENREKRGEAYRGKPAWIDLEEAKHYMASNAIDMERVPELGEKVRVLRVCNVGMGGTMRHTEISSEQKELAERIARIFQLPVIGVDFFGERVIEVNALPSLYCPTGDEWADELAERYVDYLEKL